MDLMEPTSPNLSETIKQENNEKMKAQANYNIVSNKNHCFNIIIKNLTSSIEMIASYQDKIDFNIFSKKFTLII